MGLFDRLKKPPYNPDAPVNVPAEPLVPGSALNLPASAIPEPELSERHEEISDEPAQAAFQVGTPGRRYVSVPDERFNLEDTNRLAQAMELPREQRDGRWLDE